jgi:hypothetical protein
MRFVRAIWISSVMVVIGAMWAQPASAQIRAGVRGGLSVDPDQVYVGGHIQTTPLIDQVRFRPNIEVGFGDDVTLTAFNFEFVYGFPARGPWHVYAGGGPSVNVFRFDTVTNTDAGFNLLIGAENRGGLFFEGKVGVASGANAKFGVGYTFH